MKNCLYFQNKLHTAEIITTQNSKEINNLVYLQLAIDKELTLITSLQEKLDKHEQILLQLMHRKGLLTDEQFIEI